MHKDYMEKGGEHTVDASIQTGTQVIMHSYGIEYYREEWKIKGENVYRIYSKLQISDKQYATLKLLSDSKVKLVVEGQHRNIGIEKLLKKIAQKNKWNYSPVIDLVQKSKEKEDFFKNAETAHIALLVPEIYKMEQNDNEFVMEGGFSLEFYDAVLAKQPKMWETDVILVSGKTKAEMDNNFIDEAFKRFSEKMQYDTGTVINAKSEKYDSLNSFDPGFAKVYEEAEKADIEALLFPRKAIEKWTEVKDYEKVGKDPRKALATQRINYLKEYETGQAKLNGQYPQDSEKLKELLKMDIDNIGANVAVIRDFLRKYGLLYGASELGRLLEETVEQQKKKEEIIKKTYDKTWMERLKSSCEEKNPESCYFYGYGLELTGKPVKEYEKYYEMACVGDTALACYNFSVMLLRNCSKGVDIPLKNAERACELGYTRGCFKVGTIHNNGKCSAKIDRKKALKYFVKSCDAGYYGGCAYAGALYENDKKKTEALKYYKKACEMGYEKACNAHENKGVIK
jgi:TPR repeat protein